MGAWVRSSCPAYKPGEARSLRGRPSECKVSSYSRKGITPGAFTFHILFSEDYLSSSCIVRLTDRHLISGKTLKHTKRFLKVGETLQVHFENPLPIFCVFSPGLRISCIFLPAVILI